MGWFGFGPVWVKHASGQRVLRGATTKSLKFEACTDLKAMLPTVPVHASM